MKDHKLKVKETHHSSLRRHQSLLPQPSGKKIEEKEIEISLIEKKLLFLRPTLISSGSSRSQNAARQSGLFVVEILLSLTGGGCCCCWDEDDDVDGRTLPVKCCCCCP